MEDASGLGQHSNYLSTSTVSNILAPPSPDTETSQLDMADRQSPIAHNCTSTSAPATPPLSQFAALGQLSYAPATQTTVVTTTTTTTTSFPPLILRQPKHLYERDPKQYPLAASTTPATIKDFCFDVDGTPACFSEVEDWEDSLLELNQKHTSLQSNNGILRSITNTGTQFETPKKIKEHLLAGNRAMKCHTSNENVPPQKKLDSSVSLAEAAELASMQRRTKRLRTAVGQTDIHKTNDLPNRPSRSRLSGLLDDSTPATPDTDASNTGQFKIPKGKSRVKKVGPKNILQRNLSSEEAMIRSFGRPTLSDRRDDQVRLASPLTLQQPMPGVAATPPIAESDQELAGLVDQQRLEVVPQQRRPTPLNTLTAMDASLPSPSLSPITAAATLNSSMLSGYQEDVLGEDGNEVPGLDISQAAEPTHRSRLRRWETSQSMRPQLPSSLADEEANMQPPVPSLGDIPNMLNAFDAMPGELQTYVMYQLLRRCAKPTLRIISAVVEPALKCDFLDLLPLELSTLIISNFDVQTMCRAAQVSKRWRQIVDSDETTWKTLLDKDEFTVPDGEVDRAVKEGWGWQFPHGCDSFEQDLSIEYGAPFDASSPSSVSRQQGENSTSTPSVRPKRKASGKQSGHWGNKKRKMKAPALTKTRTTSPWMRTLEMAQGPIAHANAAAMAVPNPDAGLASLRNLHLYKSIYRRQHAMRKSWMDEDSKPQHFAFRAHTRHVVTCLQFDTDKILTGSDDTKIHVYDTKTGALRSRLEGHEGGVWALQYNGNTLVSGSTDRSVRVWDIEKGRCLQIFQGHTSTVRCLVILQPTKIGEEPDGTPIIMPREPLIITGSRDSTLRVWRLPQPGERSIFQTGPIANEAENPYFLRTLVGHHHSVRAIAAHGDTVVSGSYDHGVRVWKVSNGELMHRLTGHTAKVYSVVLDHERNRCITGSMDNAVKIWSLDTGSMIHSLDGHTSLVGLLDLSHGRLVSAAADSTLRIWDPETGNCKSTLSAHTGAITCFQHDDQKVISGSDRTVKMWNVKTGECVRDLLKDLSGVWQVKFNERRCVAAVQRDNWTYLEVLDFGAARDGVPKQLRGTRIVVNEHGHETDDNTDTEDAIMA